MLLKPGSPFYLTWTVFSLTLIGYHRAETLNKHVERVPAPQHPCQSRQEQHQLGEPVITRESPRLGRTSSFALVVDTHWLGGTSSQQTLEYSLVLNLCGLHYINNLHWTLAHSHFNGFHLVKCRRVFIGIVKKPMFHIKTNYCQSTLKDFMK